MYGYKIEDYVPVPEPVSSDYTICAHYYPGWSKRNVTNSGLTTSEFHDIAQYPKRTPLLGYYDEKSPEVFDWQIKWAVEHGINCFIFCWYMKNDTPGKKITYDNLLYSHAIHSAYFNARYRDYMKFAIMWELDYAMPSDKNEVLNNVIPFWVENYFSDKNYLKIDNKPVLYIYVFKKLIDYFGGLDKTRELLDSMEEKMREYGFDGIHFSGLNSNGDIYASNQWQYSMDEYKQAGADSTFQYCWQMLTEDLTEYEYKKYCENYMLDSERILKFINKQIAQRIDYDPYYTMYALTCARDSKPWFKILNIDPKGPMVQFRLTPYEWRRELVSTKAKIDKLPDDSIGKKIVLVDNWNEWAEGHFVAPSLGSGFKYLQALREVFTKCDNLPDYRLPSTLEMGPYENPSENYF